MIICLVLEDLLWLEVVGSTDAFASARRCLYTGSWFLRDLALPGELQLSPAPTSYAHPTSLPSHTLTLSLHSYHTSDLKIASGFTKKMFVRQILSMNRKVILV